MERAEAYRKGGRRGNAGRCGEGRGRLGRLKLEWGHVLQRGTPLPRSRAGGRCTTHRLGEGVGWLGLPAHGVCPSTHRVVYLPRQGRRLRAQSWGHMDGRHHLLAYREACLLVRRWYLLQCTLRCSRPHWDRVAHLYATLGSPTLEDRWGGLRPHRGLGCTRWHLMTRHHVGVKASRGQGRKGR